MHSTHYDPIRVTAVKKIAGCEALWRIEVNGKTVVVTTAELMGGMRRGKLVCRVLEQALLPLRGLITPDAWEAKVIAALLLNAWPPPGPTERLYARSWPDGDAPLMH